MTIQETWKIIYVLKATYVNHYSHFTNADWDNMADVWTSIFSGYPYEQVSAGLKIFLASDTKGFPPSPGQVIDCILKVTMPSMMSEGEAWHIVRKAIERGSLYAEDDFAKMPEPVRRAIGSPSNIRSMATDEEYNEEVAKGQFLRAYRNILERDRDNAKIPGEVMRLIQGKTERLEVNE